MTAAMGSSCDVSGAAHLPAASRRAPIGDVAGAALTALRLEGVAPSVAHRKAALREPRQGVRRNRRHRRAWHHARLWRAIRDVTPFAASRRGRSAVVAHLDRAGQGRGACARSPAWPMPRCSTTGPAGCSGCSRLPTMAAAALVRRAVKACGGHATLIRAPAAMRAAAGVRAAGRGACRIDEAGQGELRSQGRAQSRPHVGGRVTDADHLHPRPARRSAGRGIGENPAHLRALRLLHRDLPDLCAARRRARFAARAHLPDQGHAGARPAGHAPRSSSTSTAACPASPA